MVVNVPHRNVWLVHARRTYKPQETPGLIFLHSLNFFMLLHVCWYAELCSFQGSCVTCIRYSGDEGVLLMYNLEKHLSCQSYRERSKLLYEKHGDKLYKKLRGEAYCTAQVLCWKPSVLFKVQGHIFSKHRYSVIKFFICFLCVL